MVSSPWSQAAIGAASRRAKGERDGWRRWMLLRRSRANPTSVTAYLCFAPADATLADLVHVAESRRWTVEICFEAAKQEVGLAEYEVRSWMGWHRHVTLACLAHVFLTTLRAHGIDPTDEALKGGLHRAAWPRSRRSAGPPAPDRARDLPPAHAPLGDQPTGRCGGLALSPPHRRVITSVVIDATTTVP